MGSCRASAPQVLHLEVDLSGSGMQYQPGDSLGVSPVNDSALVNGLLERLGVDGGRVFEVVAAESAEKTGLLSHLGCPCALRKALRCGVDLTSVPRWESVRVNGLDRGVCLRGSDEKQSIPWYEVFVVEQEVAVEASG